MHTSGVSEARLLLQRETGKRGWQLAEMHRVGSNCARSGQRSYACCRGAAGSQHPCPFMSGASCYLTADNASLQRLWRTYNHLKRLGSEPEAVDARNG
mmetsp:Transcript_134164/g.373921  ORF Transcript_134164/g.373921 Transcript_134164/m.373921 type:complete len:98 (-) Transcript_134164:15-308(-)